MITLDGIEISPSLLWADETSWSPVVQHQAYGVSGSLFIDASVMLAGRPITLAASENQGWVPRSTVLALLDLAAVPAKEMLLTLGDGRQFTVVFRHDSGPPVEARQVVGYNTPDPAA